MGQSFSSSIQGESADSSPGLLVTHEKYRDDTSYSGAAKKKNDHESFKPPETKSRKCVQDHSSKNATTKSLDSTASIAPSARHDTTSSSKRSSSSLSTQDHHVEDTGSMTDLAEQIPQVSLEADVHKNSSSFSAIAVTSLSDILTLTNSEIKARLANTQFSIQNIREANDTILKYNLCSQDDIFSWYQDHTSININEGITTNANVVPCQRKSNKVQEGYHDDQTQETTQNPATLLQERNHMKLALLMLKLSPQLKSVRFKMVPSKISESYFWNAVFYLLLTPRERDNLLINNIHGLSAYNENHTDDGGYQLKMMILEKNREMELLQQQLMQLQQTVANLQQQQQQQDKQQEQSSSMTLNNHCGTWIMDKESHEFLALDEEIKSKLRDGKKKRLEDVQEQMKFILDSDNVEDSRGRWDCCGKTSYKSKCSCY